MSTFMRWETIEEIEIFGGSWALSRIKDLLYGVVLRGIRPPMKIHFHEISAGEIFTSGDFRISAFPVYHRGSDCFGFLFEEASRRPFLEEKAQTLGVPPGPWRRDLVNGSTVTLPDGRQVYPDQVLGPERPGTRYVHVGDVGRAADLVQICQDADVLVIEATYLHAEHNLAEEFSHFTARQAAELAVQTGVKHLILTHISRRYRERDVLAEARLIKPNTFIARDFDSYQIKRGDLLKLNLLDN